MTDAPTFKVGDVVVVERGGFPGVNYPHLGIAQTASTSISLVMSWDARGCSTENMEDVENIRRATEADRASLPGLHVNPNVVQEGIEFVQQSIASLRRKRRVECAIEESGQSAKGRR